jgi:nucleoside-diphosphate-sugar epimerase/putative sterol carrier protein
VRIVVTGGAGQLGTAVIRRLLHNRKHTIVCIDTRPPLVVPGGRVRAVAADVRDHTIRRHFEDADALVHLAFVMSAPLPRPELHAINVDGSKNVFTVAAAVGIRHILYASSVAAYGLVPGHPHPVVEDTPRKNQAWFPYASAKYEVEAFLDEFERVHPEVAVTRFRPGILVGAHMDHALGRALRAGFLPYMSRAPLPLVWDEDVADAFALALDKRVAGAFNLVADEPLPAPTLARATGLHGIPAPRILLKAANAVARVVEPGWLDGATVVPAFSSEKAKRELGWTPRCPTSRAVIERFRDEIPQRLDPRLRAFFAAVALVGRFRPPPEEARTMRARIHLRLTGPRGGDVGVLLEDGRIAIVRGIPRPPTSIARIPAETFLDFLRGKQSFSTAMMTGRIHIEGDPSAGMLLQGMVTTFRARFAKKEAVPMPTRGGEG